MSTQMKFSRRAALAGGAALPFALSASGAVILFNYINVIS